jgi:TIR domain
VNPFVFFTSYARPDNNKVSKLSKVVEELLERVRGKLGLPVKPEEVGFFDRTNIQTAKQWEEVLGSTLRTRVIVCLCSPTYFNSAFCAKEFEIFRQRVEKGGDKLKDVPVIVPVIWERPSEPLESWVPKVVSKY